MRFKNFVVTKSIVKSQYSSSKRKTNPDNLNKINGNQHSALCNLN